MDMYQKRKMRQEKVNNENEEETQKQMNINWYHGHLVQTQEDQYVNQQHFVE